MATISRAEAIRTMTTAVVAEPDLDILYEYSRDFLPAETTRGEPRATTVARLVKFINDDLSPDLVAEFLRLVHINEYRDVWYNEEDDHIYFRLDDEYDSVGVR